MRNSRNVYRLLGAAVLFFAVSGCSGTNKAGKSETAPDSGMTLFDGGSNMPAQPPGDANAPAGLAALFAVDEPRDPINVLMITATHGFRHGPAIDVSKTVMEELSKTTEFRFDITEDLSVLTKENLSQYDLLFFVNSTLRLKSEPPPAASAGMATMGDWGNWEITMISPQGGLQGNVAISSADDGYTGSISFVQFPGVTPLSDITVEGDALSFSWDAGPYGTPVAVATMAGDTLDGVIRVEDAELELKGKKVTAGMEVNATGSWTLKAQTPNGMRTFLIELGGEEALTGTMTNPQDPDHEEVTLMDVKLEGAALTFYFTTPDEGRIDAEATIDGNAVNGVFSAGDLRVPFEGKREVAFDESAREVLVSEAQQGAIMDFLAQGKGIVGAHAALDAFYEWAEYKEMVGGGLFESHPWTQNVRIFVEEKDDPSVAHFGDSFSIRDEIYVLDENPRWNSKVLLSLDMSSVDAQGDPHGNYRNDFPISWVREHNGGRVFYTKLGHFPDVWTTPGFLQHLLQGMRMTAGRIESDFSGRLVKETIADNVWPDDIAVDDNNNVWIAELNGKVHRYDAETGETKLVAEVPTTDPMNIEHGLFGIEVDPNFYTGEPYVYLYYAERETIINTLSRFRYVDGRIDLSSEEVILRVPTEPQCCHQAGDLEWGPDGTLYLSTGDTGMSETRPEWELTQEEIDAFMASHDLKEIQWSRLVDSERSAQNLQDLRGKILRINKDGSIPKDNPFYGRAGVRWEIYAYGLRNPYRFKVDQETGYLYIGVVGPDAQFDYDEYNISMKGGENFGWPREIGRLEYNEWTPDMIPDYMPPIWEYTYETGGRSASGGPIYRHEGAGAFPPIFQDRIFVYDWARGWIKYGKLVEDKVVLEKTNGETFEMTTPRLVDVKTFDILQGTRPISMELGPDGALYVAEFTGFWYAAPGSKVTRYRWESNDK